MGPQELWQYCQLEANASRVLRTATNQYGFSARGYHRVLKVARTIADLEGSATIGEGHLLEALQYRPGSLV